MNLSAALMLVDKTVRPVRVEYDTDYKNNNPGYLFKTIIPDLQKGDLVVVPTSTRHGFTIAKVSEVGFAVDFEAPMIWSWVADRFDKASFDKVLEVEQKITGRVAQANEDRMREQLRQSMGLAGTDFSDLTAALSPSLPAPTEEPKA